MFINIELFNVLLVTAAVIWSVLWLQYPFSKVAEVYSWRKAFQSWDVNLSFAEMFIWSPLAIVLAILPWAFIRF